MPLYARPQRISSRADRPYNPGQRHHRADFARAATISAFGRHAWALDHADFVDRQPWERPACSPEVWPK